MARQVWEAPAGFSHSDADEVNLGQIINIEADILKPMLTGKEFSKADGEAIAKMADGILVPFRDKPAPDPNKK